MEGITAVIVGILSCGGFTSLTQYLLDKRKRKEEWVRKEDVALLQAQTDALNEGVKAILSDRLEYLTSKYHKEGCITETQYKALVTLHDAYKGVGGNGYIDDSFKSVTEMYTSQFKK